MFVYACLGLSEESMMRVEECLDMEDMENEAERALNEDELYDLVLMNDDMGFHEEDCHPEHPQTAAAVVNTDSAMTDNPAITSAIVQDAHMEIEVEDVDEIGEAELHRMAAAGLDIDNPLEMQRLAEECMRHHADRPVDESIFPPVRSFLA